jgi:hypothetical protein
MSQDTGEFKLPQANGVVIPTFAIVRGIVKQGRSEEKDVN